MRLKLSKILSVLCTSVAVFSSVDSGAATAYFGTNFSGGEFGDIGKPYGQGYIYPSASEIQYFANKGFKIGRLPFKWERLQPVLGGPLDSAEVARLTSFLNSAQNSGIRVLLDMHNYGQYQNVAAGWKSYIGSSNVSIAQYADVWAKIAVAFRSNPGLLGYDIMNEPEGFSTAEAWPNAAQAAINSIRAVDSSTDIYVEGDCWASAQQWPNCGTRGTLSGSGLVYEAHQYLDASASGNYDGKTYDGEGATPTTGIERVKPFVDWCNTRGVRCFVGEYGVPGADARWLATQENMIKYLAANCISGTWWSSGPWWGDYVLSIEPRSTGDALQMPMLSKYTSVACAGSTPTPTPNPTPAPTPAPTPIPTPFPSPTPVNSARIINSNSKKCLDSAEAYTTGSSAVIQMTCTSVPSQAWTVKTDEKSLTTFTAFNGKCLGIEPTNNWQTKLSACNGSSDQKWSIVQKSDHVLIYSASRNWQCFDIDNGSKDNRALLDRWDCDDGLKQRFTIVR